MESLFKEYLKMTHFVSVFHIEANKTNAMLNIISILIGIIAFIIALVGLFPFVGIVNWAAIPIAFIGLVIGTFSSIKTGRTLNLIVLAVAMLRLILGGGIL
ncbi:MAG: hypothetical protein QM669_12800 [Siphonobacter sp.]